MTDVDDFLAHYGVLGMKWGHRKRADGTPVQYETVAGGHRDSAPGGKPSYSSGRVGFAADIENLSRKLSKEGAGDRAARKTWQNTTGHKTTMRNFRHNPLDPIRTDYTNQEIKAARASVKQARQEFDKHVKKGKAWYVNGPYSAQQERWDVREWASSRNSVIAEKHTIGERAVATMLLGPVGAYMTSQARDGR